MNNAKGVRWRMFQKKELCDFFALQRHQTERGGYIYIYGENISMGTHELVRVYSSEIWPMLLQQDEASSSRYGRKIWIALKL